MLLHASVEDIEAAMMDGRWAKNDGRLVAPRWPEARPKFLGTAKRLQDAWRNMSLPEQPVQFNGSPVVDLVMVDVQRGAGRWTWECVYLTWGRC